VISVAVNAYFGSNDYREKALSNLSFSPFIFEGKECHSFEGFYQGTKRSGTDMQEHIFKTFGFNAKKKSKPTKNVYWDGQVIKAGSDEHHELLFKVQVCKYTQHQSSRESLLETGSSQIVHRVGRDSIYYPARVYCQQLTKIRSLIQKGQL
jgi:predicted NAD-dependent protein-ADP-ribosyltransferase YbiA (DUF1768 family)